MTSNYITLPGELEDYHAQLAHKADNHCKITTHTHKLSASGSENDKNVTLLIYTVTFSYAVRLTA